MPAVALSFAVAAVAGQNLGARQPARVRETFRESAKLSIGFMLLFTILCQLMPQVLMGLFSDDAAVVAVGAGYLRTLSLVYVASGLVMVAAGMFQGIGNTIPSLVASASRLLFFVLPVLWISQRDGFTVQQVWWLSAASVLVQMLLSLTLLRREFNRKLAPL